MLVVRVELWSARTGEKTELARMHICNTGENITDHADYVGQTFRGRTKEDLNKQIVVRSGEVNNWAREQNHVWRLVAKMLTVMGY